MSIREALTILKIGPTVPLSPTLLKGAFVKRALELHPDTQASSGASAPIIPDEVTGPRPADSHDFRRLGLARRTIADALRSQQRPSDPLQPDDGPTGASLDSSYSTSSGFSSTFSPRRPSSLEDYADFAAQMGAEAHSDLLKAAKAARRGSAVLKRGWKEGPAGFVFGGERARQEREGGSERESERAPRKRLQDLADKVEDPFKIREQLTKGLDRAYFGPKLPWEAAEGASSTQFDDWPCAFECEQRSSQSAALSRAKMLEGPTSSSSSASPRFSSDDEEKGNQQHRLPHSENPGPDFLPLTRPDPSLPSSLSSVDNILEIVVGRKLLGFVRPSSSSPQSLELFYRSGVIATCSRTEDMIKIRCPRGKTIFSILDDGGGGPQGGQGDGTNTQSFIDKVPFVSKLRNAAKKRRICKVFTGDGARGVESHVLLFFTTPGVNHMYVIANDGKKRSSKEGNALEEELRESFSHLGNLHPDSKAYGRIESKVTRAALLPPSMWLWESRTETHNHGSFLFERITKNARKHAVEVDFDMAMDGWFTGTDSNPVFGEESEDMEQGGKKRLLHPAVLTLLIALMCAEKEYDA